MSKRYEIPTETDEVSNINNLFSDASASNSEEESKMSSLNSKRKEARLHAHTDANILSARTYNLALGGTVLYGLLVNVLMYLAFGDVALQFNPIVFFIVYFVGVIIGIVISIKSNNPAISFLGYNLVVVPIGLVVGIIVKLYVKDGDASIVFHAIVLTAVITSAMIALSIMFPEFFSKLGGLLFGALVGLSIAELLSIFLFPWAQNALAWFGAILFTLYIGYDYWKAQKYPKTLDNAVDSALDLYLDIINLFLYILDILDNSKSSKRD